MAGQLITDPRKLLEKVQLLIIDNCPRMAQLYRNIFRQLGFSSIFSAHDGVEGVQMMREMRIDIVVSDWELKLHRSLPGNDSSLLEDIVPVSGVDFVKRLRTSPSSPNPFIPVIMMAEQVHGREVTEAINAGVNEIIVKPFNAEDLCDRMMRVVDHPRIFITSLAYKGPCRRRRKGEPPTEYANRRTKEVKIVRHPHIEDKR